MATEKRAGADEIQLESTDAGLDHLKNVDLGDKGLNNGALEGNAEEHSLGVLQAFKTYRRAALWSMLISTTVIMEGYDVTLLGSFFGYPSFRRKYGEFLDEEHGYQISASWQQKFNCLAALANVIGALFNGWATSRWGHRKVLMFSLFWLAAFIFITFFAPNVEVMLAGMFLCNIPWGVFATTGPAYAAEVSPMAIRSYLTAYINLCWCIGQFISAGVLAGLVNNKTQWSYKIPFAIQWIWPLPLFIAAFLAPESPWHLVRVNQLEKARRSLERLSQPEHNVNYEAKIAMMVHTNKLEISERAGVTYWDAFRGTNLRRTEIACMGFLSHITNGGALCYSGTFFFQQAGIADDTAYSLGLGGTAIAFVGTCLSWTYLDRWGRRRIWLVGFSTLVAILWIIGFLALPNQENKALGWAQSVLCLVWLGVYSASVGPIVYTLISEIGSTRLRTQTVVLARSTYYAGNVVGGGLIQPQLLAPGAWNAKGKTAFFWSTLATLTLIWGYFRIFETKDRTFGELDYMFQKGVRARDSAKYKISEEEMYAVEEIEQKQ